MLVIITPRIGPRMWRRRWHPTPVLLPGKSHGWRSLVGCSPWGHKESDTTERIHFHFSLSCIGEGNGNPLQCSCLENPRDGEPGGLSSLGLHRVGHDWSNLAAAMYIRLRRNEECTLGLGKEEAERDVGCEALCCIWRLIVGWLNYIHCAKR